MHAKHPACRGHGRLPVLPSLTPHRRCQAPRKLPARTSSAAPVHPCAPAHTLALGRSQHTTPPITTTTSAHLVTSPLVPPAAPQVLRIGQLVILSVPGEFTTMAGRRLKRAVQSTVSMPARQAGRQAQLSQGAARGDTFAASGARRETKGASVQPVPAPGRPDLPAAPPPTHTHTPTHHTTPHVPNPASHRCGTPGARGCTS